MSEQEERWSRLEEGQMFLERQSDQMGEQMLALSRAVDRLTRRLEALERRVAGVEEKGAGGEEPAEGDAGAEAPGA